MRPAAMDKATSWNQSKEQSFPRMENRAPGSTERRYSCGEVGALTQPLDPGSPKQ
jgi:hypothetical protein